MHLLTTQDVAANTPAVQEQINRLETSRFWTEATAGWIRQRLDNTETDSQEQWNVTSIVDAAFLEAQTNGFIT